MKLPDQDLELIEEFKRAFEFMPMMKVDRLIQIISRQSKALVEAMEVYDEIELIDDTGIGFEEMCLASRKKIQALLNGDVK